MLVNGCEPPPPCWQTIVLSYPSELHSRNFINSYCINIITQQTKTARRVKQRHENWRKWRIRCMSRDLKHCHPQWPEEKRYLKGEIKRIQEMPSAFLRGLWDYYEWVSFIGIFAIIGAQIAFIVTHASKARTVLDLTYLLETLLIWLRLLKPFKTVSALSGLIVMLGK